MSEISRLAHKSELRRQLLHNRVRKVGIRAARRLPNVALEFLKMLAASVIGFWIITELLAYFSPAEPLYTLPALGLLFSAQATFYKVKLARDPDFEVPSCGCGLSRPDDTASVLRSKESAILGIPNSVVAIVVYVALLTAVFASRYDAAIALAVAAGMASAYLAYVMVFRLASLCSTCVNVVALNVLILVELVR